MASSAVAIRSASPVRRVNRNVIVRRVRHRASKITIPVALFAGFVPLVTDVGIQVSQGNWQQAGMVLEHNILGVNPWSGKWDTQGFAHGLYPIAAGFGVHWLAGKLGVNRLLARSRVPFIRI